MNISLRGGVKVLPSGFPGSGRKASLGKLGSLDL